MSITETTTRAKTAKEQTSVAVEKAWSMPDWAITTVSLVVLIGLWQAAAPFIDPLFGSYPSQIFSSFLVMMESGTLGEGILAEHSAVFCRLPARCADRRPGGPSARTLPGG
ncbi:hypothetical protein ABIA24_005537 [Sinorhizobium fredii]|uniref:hypothetical protein n=1 Tax=Rhizobium fredii TaxID=380 RepID=UPI00351134BE